MKNASSPKNSTALSLLGRACVLFLALGHGPLAGAQAAPRDVDSPPPQTSEIAALKAEVERLKGMVPDQSHAMKDVGYHFTNLWFAAQKQNWPLADFYLSETRSHLRWAVRIIPVRKTPQGQDLRLGDLLDGFEKTTLVQLHDAVAGRDAEGFRKGYEQMLSNCYSCHVAAGKPYLRLQIPERPEVSIIDFNPAKE